MILRKNSFVAKSVTVKRLKPNHCETLELEQILIDVIQHLELGSMAGSKYLLTRVNKHKLSAHPGNLHRI